MKTEEIFRICECQERQDFRKQALEHRAVKQNRPRDCKRGFGAQKRSGNAKKLRFPQDAQQERSIDPPIAKLVQPLLIIARLCFKRRADDRSAISVTQHVHSQSAYCQLGLSCCVKIGRSCRVLTENRGLTMRQSQVL